MEGPHLRPACEEQVFTVNWCRLQRNQAFLPASPGTWLTGRGSPGSTRRIPRRTPHLSNCHLPRAVPGESSKIRPLPTSRCPFSTALCRTCSRLLHSLGLRASLCEGTGRVMSPTGTQKEDLSPQHSAWGWRGLHSDSGSIINPCNAVTAARLGVTASV